MTEAPNLVVLVHSHDVSKMQCLGKCRVASRTLRSPEGDDIMIVSAYILHPRLCSLPS